MQNKRYQFLSLTLLGFLLILTACGGNVTESGALTPPAPVVDYGASLSEWEEAASESDPSTSDNLVLAPTLPVPEVASPVPVASPTSSEFVLPEAEQNAEQQSLDAKEYKEIGWENLVPAGFTPDEIASKYQDQLAQFQDGDPAALELYNQMQEEFNNAPINEELDGTKIKLPGFIAPLEYNEDEITEFLLVPYFGACIHVPAPPTNQTVYVKTAKGEGVAARDAYNPIWIFGTMQAETNETELAKAGYFVEDATIELYSYDD